MGLLTCYKVYFCGDFGLSILNLSNNFIEATFFRNEAVQSLVFKPKQKEIYALKEGELYRGLLVDNLQDPKTWKKLDFTFSGTSEKPKFKQIRLYKEKLLALAENGKVFILENGEAKALELELNVKSLKKLDLGLFLQTKDDGLYLLQDLSASAKLVAKSSVLDFTTAVDDAALVLLYPNNKVAQLKNLKEANKLKPIKLDTDSPFDNKYFEMRVSNGILYSVNGGRHTNRLSNKGVVQVYNGIKWQNIAKNLNWFYDPVSILPHYSGEQGHCYVGTWGEGLYEFKGGKVIKHYDTKNSALQSALGNGRNDYIRVGALTYNRQKTLLMGQGGGFIASMTKDGKWQSYNYEQALHTNSFTQQIAMPNGVTWISDYHKGNNSEGLFVYDTKGTANKGDDVSAHYSNFVDRKGKVLAIGKVKAMCLDKSGVLWLGSSIGYCSLARPSQISKGNTLPMVSRPIGGDEPPYYYVLDRIPISAIVVDNLNRKWIGTENNGLYLVSADGLKVLEHYQAEDSPLLDNAITTLAFDERAGKLYIGTNKGLNALMIATDERSLSSKPSAIAYPNPLRPEDPDIITFEGLPANATLLISDTYGHTILKTRTVGTSYKWDVYQKNGRRLAEGVYFAHIYAPNSDEPQQIKIAIISSNTYQ